MNKCPHAFALAALLGLCTTPVTAAPQELRHDENATLAATEDGNAIKLKETEGGWAFGGSVGLDFCSKQLTYGLIDNPHPILTPSVELSFGHEDWFTLAVGAEAIFDTTNWGAKDGGYNDRRYKYQEFAPGITLSRTWKSADWLGSDLDTSLNYTYEYHPHACKKPDQDYSNPDTQWLNAEISAGDFWLRPTFTLEYQLVRQGEACETDGKGGIYATFSLSHDFDIGAALGLDAETLLLTPSLGLGMANKARNQADFETNDSFMFRDGFGTLELVYTPFEGFAITPYVGFAQQLDSKAREAVGNDDFVAYAGLGVSFEF